MSRMRRSKPLLGLLSSIVLMLAGCGGNSGSGDRGGSTSRVSHITLQLTRSTEAPSAARHQGIASGQVRQVQLQSGDAGFIERLEVRVQQPRGLDLLPPQVFTLDAAEQEAVTRDVTVPEPLPTEFQVLVTAFNNFNNRQTAIFLGNTLVRRGDVSATIALVRNPDPNTLVLVPATPADFQQTVFTFVEGAAFGLSNIPVTLAAGAFEGNTGDFTLVSGGFIASGQVTIGSCNFAVTTSTFPPGRGPQVGDHIAINPCEVDAIDRRLIMTNVTLSTTSVSETPASVSSAGVLILPPSPPTLVTDEDTSGTAPTGVALTGNRPGQLTFTITGLPAHGTAVVDAIGLVTYRPAADFHGSDHLVVAVTATFSDGNSPSVLLETVAMAITVRSVNDTPVITSPGDQTTPEGTVVSLPVAAQDVEGEQLTFSATGLPPGLTINPITGGIRAP